jgi:hypothetical protein
VAIVANPSVSALYEDALVYETGTAITSSGALSAYSGNKTGRSPLDKRVVKEEGSEKDVWWGPVNKPMSPEVSLPVSYLAVLLFSISTLYTPNYSRRQHHHTMMQPDAAASTSLVEGMMESASLAPISRGGRSPQRLSVEACMWTNGRRDNVSLPNPLPRVAPTRLP